MTLYWRTLHFSWLKSFNLELQKTRCGQSYLYRIPVSLLGECYNRYHLASVSLPRTWTHLHTNCSTICDNQSAIALASNRVLHARIKHIEIDDHFVREKVQAKVINIGYVPSLDQIADIFTKALPEFRFQSLRQKLCLQSHGDIRLNRGFSGGVLTVYN